MRARTHLGHLPSSGSRPACPPRGRGPEAWPPCCCRCASRPRGGRGPRGPKARLPSPCPPASLYPTSGFPRWLGSVAAAQEPFWTRFSSPPPAPPPPHPPCSWPLRTRPLRPGPGPSPDALCLSRARPGPWPTTAAAAPRSSRRPGARTAAYAARSGPEPGPWNPARCPGTKALEARGGTSRRQEREGYRGCRPAGPARPGSAARPYPWARGVRGAAPEHDGALGGPRPPLGIAVRR